MSQARFTARTWRPTGASGAWMQGRFDSMTSRSKADTIAGSCRSSARSRAMVKRACTYEMPDGLRLSSTGHARTGPLLLA